MQPLGPTLKTLRLRHHLTLQQLADLAGCSKAYLSTIENGRRASPPKTPLLEAIEKAMELAPGHLTKLADWQATPQSIKNKFNQLTTPTTTPIPPFAISPVLPSAASKFSLDGNLPRRADGSRDLDALFRSGQLHRQASGDAPIESSASIEAADRPLCSVPLINKVAAGYPTEFTDLDYPAAIADAYVPCPNLDDPDAFAATVVGESMAPIYQEGQTIIFSPAIDPADGHDCFVRILPDHHTTFKRVFFQEDQTVRLHPLNSKFPEAIIPLRQISGLYPAVMRIDRLHPAPQ